MDYTLNYHLPQWEQTDPVRMSDFNGAMRAIDTGLAQKENDAFSRLCRAAGNHWRLWNAQGGTASQSGVFYYSCAKGAGAAPDNMIQRSDSLWTASSAKVLTLADITPSVVETSTISTTSNTWSITFTSPYPGHITKINLTGSALNNTVSSRPYTITLTNTGTNQVEDKVTDTATISTGNAYGFSLPTDILLCGGQKYKLAFTFTSIANMTPTYYMLKDMEYLVVTGIQPGGATISRTLAADGDGQGAVVLVHYSTIQGKTDSASGLTLEVGGQRFTPAFYRNVKTRAGTSVREAEFRVNQTVSRTSALKLLIQPSDNVDVSLYEWGGILL